MKLTSFLLGLLLLLGTAPAALAAALPAGFPAGPLWLSREGLVDGDKVKAYAAAYNAGDQAIEGEAAFLADGTQFGAMRFSLAAGASTVVSASWRATSGNHEITAVITSATDKNTKEPVSLSGAALGPLSVAVAPPAEDVPAIAAARAAIKDTVPALSDTTDAVLSFTESLRTAGEDYLASKIGNDAAAPADAGTGSVLAAETVRGPSTLAAAAAVGSTASSHPIPSALHAVFASPALFYLLLLLIALFGFWLLFRRLTRSAV